MKKLRRVSLQFLILLVAGCSSSGSSTPIPSTSVSDNKPSSPASVQLVCGDWDTAQAKSYKVQNNVWGKGTVTGYSQCVGIGDGENESVAARWTWNWPTSDTQVKGYPEIIFGRKPGHATTSSALPRQVANIQTATVSFNYTTTHSGRGNTSFDLWLSRDPDVVDDSRIEVMIWLDWYGGINPAGPFVRSATIDGRDYDVFVGTVGSGHPYMAFRIKSALVGSGTINLRSFLDHLRDNGHITGTEYLQSIEFGNEASTGSGDTSVYSYSVDVR